MSAGLFDMEPTVVAAEPVEKLSAGRKRTWKREVGIANGMHPLSNVIPGLRLHVDAPRERDAAGPRCDDCCHATRSGDYNKCDLYISGCESSDLRLWWPACTRFVAKP